MISPNLLKLYIYRIATCDATWGTLVKLAGDRAGFGRSEYLSSLYGSMSRGPTTYCVCVCAGKSTLVDRLTDKLSACRLQSPPDEIRHLRAGFDSQPAVIRRAYYYLGNYVLARRVRQLTTRQTVVLDRWLSLFALRYSSCGSLGRGMQTQGHLSVS